MENFTITIKVLLGVLLGAGMSLIPNASPPLITISISSLLGPEACVGALCSSMFYKTFIECTAPDASGDEMINMTIEEDRQILSFFGNGIVTRHVMLIKTYAMIIGLSLGVVVGLLNFPLLAPLGVSWGAIIIGAAILFVKVYSNDDGELYKTRKQVLAFLAVTTSWTWITLFLEIPFPVLSLGLCLFIIPTAFKKEKERKWRGNPNRLECWVPDKDTKLRYTTIFAALASAGAGVNFNITNTCLNKGIPRLLNYFFIYTLIEFIALGRIGVGAGASGISQIGSEVYQIHLIHILISCVVTLTSIAYFWYKIKEIELYYLNNLNFLKKLGGIIAIAAVFIMAGIFAPFLIGIGYLINKNLRDVPSEIKGFMYLIPVIS